MNGSLREISLLELGDTVGTPPSQTLMGSVRRHGVMQPVVVAETPDQEGVIGLRIIDGNRRIAAARSARIKHLPAIVLTDVAQEELSTITLVLNGFRASNYLTEFWAIKQLEREGANEADISAISGLSRSKVDQRTSLSDLSRELFVALRNGKIYQTHAAAIAKMPPKSQAVLTDTFRIHGRLTQYDLAPYKVRQSTRGRKPVEPIPTPSIAWDAESSQYRGRPASDPIVDGLMSENGELQPPTRSAPLSSEPATVSEAVEVSQGYGRPVSDQADDDLEVDNSQSLAPSVPSVNEPVPQESSREASPPYESPGSEIFSSNPVASHSLNGQGHTSVGTVATMETTKVVTGSSFSNRLDTLLRNSVVAARDMDYSKEEFLELAARKWDEVNG